MLAIQRKETLRSFQNDMSTDVPLSFLGFAQWAFDPIGFPKLRLLLYGDFSQDGRYMERNTVLCRNENFSPNNEKSSEGSDYSNLSFREVRDDDKELWDLCKEHSDFLGACALGELPSSLVEEGEYHDSSEVEDGTDYSSEPVWDSDEENAEGLGDEI